MGSPNPAALGSQSLALSLSQREVWLDQRAWPGSAHLNIGARIEVRVEGIATALPATLRSIRSEPSFTPYYALAGDDASRLVYQAELLLDGGADLPAGLPVTAVPLAP